MAETIERIRRPHAETVPISRQAAPIRWWAWFGGFLLALQVYAYSRQILAGNFRRIDSGPEPIPLSFRVAAHSFEILFISLVIFGLYRYVYRPWRNDGRLSTFGMIWMASITVYWQDWLPNWAAPVGNFSGALWFNMGSWYNFIPGWVSPNGDSVAEFSSLGVPGIILLYGLPSVFLCWLLKKVKARWPRIGPSGILLTAFAAAFVLDALVEIPITRAGLWSYSGSIPAVTLFAGHYYQFPILEPFIMATLWGPLGALVYFVDDKGRTWIERGAERLNISKRREGWLRFLAFSAFLNLITLIFTLFWIFITIHPDYQWNKDVVGKRPYLIQGICGPGTKVACPAKGTPIPRQGGIYIDPEGNIVHDGKIVTKVPLRYN